MTIFFLAAFLLSGAANLVFSLLLLRGLAAADVRVSFFEIRWQVHKHLKTYKELTRAQSGRVGFPYYGYIGTGICLLTFGLLLLLSF